MEKILDFFYYKLPFTKEDRSQEYVELKNYLENNDGWYLIIDNISPSGYNRISGLLPKKGGTIIVSLNKDEISIPDSKKYKMKGFTKEDGRKYLESFCPCLEKDFDNILNHFADSANGSIIPVFFVPGSQNIKYSGFDGYMKEFKEHYLEISRINEKLAGTPGIDSNKYKNGLGSILISLKRLQKKPKKGFFYKIYEYIFGRIRTEEEELLILLSCFSPNLVSEDLLYQSYLNLNNLKGSDRLSFNASIHNLANTAIVQRSDHNLKLHSFLQDILFNYFYQEDVSPVSSFFSLKKKKKYFESSLKAFSTQSLKGELNISVLFDHLLHFQSENNKKIYNVNPVTLAKFYFFVFKILQETHSTFANNYSLYSKKFIGNILSKQKHYLAQSLEIIERELGVNHPLTLTSKNSLASVYYKMGEFNKSKELNQQVLEIRERELGENHPLTLTSKSNLASVYNKMGEFNKSKELNQQVLEIRERELGENHPLTLTSKSNLASVYYELGEFNKSKELSQQVLEISEREFGENHPLTLTSKNNLASVYDELGEFNKSKELNQQVLEIRERELGENHPLTLTSKSNLASVYNKMGEFNKSKELNQQVLEISERELGENHPLTLNSKILQNLLESISEK